MYGIWIIRSTSMFSVVLVFFSFGTHTHTHGWIMVKELLNPEMYGWKLLFVRRWSFSTLASWALRNCNLGLEIADSEWDFNWIYCCCWNWQLWCLFLIKMVPRIAFSSSYSLQQLFTCKSLSTLFPYYWKLIYLNGLWFMKTPIWFIWIN